MAFVVAYIVCRILVQTLVAFRVSIEKSGGILIGLFLLYVTWGFFLTDLNILSLCLLFCLFCADGSFFLVHSILCLLFFFAPLQTSYLD